MEPLFFQSCEEVDTYFREGREFFNETYVKKLAQTSTYFSRIRENTWPVNHGTQQKGFRFGRGFFDPTKPWRKIKSQRCEADSCDAAPERIKRPGTESYFFDLLRKEMITDWICVEDLMYRLMPVDEIMQFEQTNAIITRSVHEEFTRTTYVGSAGHKWLALVNEDNEYCDDFDDQAWIMQESTGTDEGGFDSRYIRVKVPHADLNKIAFLSLDLLDDALVDLGDEDEAYRIDLRDVGILKMDMIVPDPKTARRLFAQAKQANGFWNTDAEFDKTLSDLRLGVPRTIGDYTFSYDNNALRYNEDTEFNAALLASDGYAFDENDPDTWPRLIRVMRYEEGSLELGYAYTPNRDFRKADFGITIHWMNDAMLKWRNPNWTGTGKVQMESQNYAGDFEWDRPKWECNMWGKQGFFKAQFRIAMQVKDPTIMHAFLHRMDHSKTVSASPCPLQTYVAPTPIDTYVCQGVQPTP
jgi:hypothetical protein